MTANTLIILCTSYIAIITAAGLAMLLSRGKREKLRTHGRRVMAIVTDVLQEREERGPAEFPIINYCYYIEAQWTDPQTGTTHLFKSQRLTSSPKEYTLGTFIPVRLDPNHPTRYSMELPEYDM